jgi:hypothetical protein
METWGKIAKYSRNLVQLRIIRNIEQYECSEFSKDNSPCTEPLNTQVHTDYGKFS